MIIASPAPLNPPIGASRPSIATLGSVVGWPSRSSTHPSGMRSPFLLVDPNLSVGRPAKRGVVRDGRHLSCRYGDRKRINAQDPLGTSPRCHRWDRICSRDSDHVVRQRHAGEIRHGTAVIAAANGSRCDAGLRCFADHLPHGQGSADLSH